MHSTASGKNNKLARQSAAIGAPIPGGLGPGGSSLRTALIDDAARDVGRIDRIAAFGRTTVFERFLATLTPSFSLLPDPATPDRLVR